MSEVRLTVEPRSEFGKGAARRTRRAGKIPAVLYGHGVDPRHLALPAIEFARVVRENGQNAVITLDVTGDAKDKPTELALTKTVTFHPLKNYIEHVDLLVVQRGEKLTVDVPVTVTGQAGPGTLVTQELDTLQVEAEAMTLPEHLEIAVDGSEAGTQLTASQVALPSGTTLVTDPEALVVVVSEAPTEADMEATVDTEGAGVVEEKPETAESA
ncbi:50S ribosomal protein L25/general stress protein Ctc [Saccharomonospora piscinae]|uniref:Large ribosomal subunit protein bL25 n=1 Tax=Saccharomonospora piscinae TaxID=687388 RepID=A0A1V9A5U8_SACPI|nr:50S ribosomal protein L25/general stress protein Ctc [Saccharomonospora piscinae]OQO92525.1 50S ribosomal protein L25/general stress protein Ctc [Saccharomonospora piscinae]TLW91769.1 50S ribosomal protein L25/general stress protein Ctc [Saccharomonospora piscinae]